MKYKIKHDFITIQLFIFSQYLRYRSYNFCLSLPQQNRLSLLNKLWSILKLHPNYTSILISK
jgi:hypothetical protein